MRLTMAELFETMKSNNRFLMHRDSGIIIESRRGNGEAIVVLGGNNAELSIGINHQTKISITEDVDGLEIGLDSALFLVPPEGWSKGRIRKSKKTVDA
jgi:hypothetical protein